MGGRGGASGISRQKPTNAKAIENMNEAQINREIFATEAKIKSAKGQREKYNNETAEEKAQREAFPLGTGGLSKRAAEKRAGKLAESAANKGRKLEAAIKRQEEAEKRLKRLESAKKEIKGTGKTQAEVRKETKTALAGSMKWKTTQKAERVGNGFRPRVMQSGAYELRGNSVIQIYRNGTQIGTAYSLKDAKAFVSVYEKKRKK